MKKFFFPFFISLLPLAFPLPISAASCPPPYAKIDSISPHKSCLQITDATKFCGGRIAIFNNCFQPYYVDGKILQSRLAAFPLLNQKNWTVTIKDARNTETITVKGTSTKENFTAKPYAVRNIPPTGAPVKTAALNTMLFSKLIPLFFIVVLIAVFLVVIAVKILRKKGSSLTQRLFSRKKLL
jgi:hypothetical protein